MSILIRENRDNYWMLNWLDKFMEGHKGFICGGCFKNIFNQEKVKDLDIFFQNEGDREEAVDYFDSMTAGYTDGTMEDTVSEDEAEYRFLYENDNVKAYVHKETGIRLELISKIYGTAEQIISQFDFSITKFAYYKAEIEDETGAEMEELPFDDGNKVETHIEYRVIYDDKFFEHLHLKRLDKLDCTEHDQKVREEAYRDFIKEFESRVNSKDISEKLFETECILLERDKNETN